ncbi:MAG: cupin domain-containing protein [Bacteroidales bacterium]|nr:cupin domain-containing protein [Bacteroidales bacterium]
MENKKRSANFLIAKELEWEELGGGVSRQIMGFDANIMMVKVKFKTGSVGSPHDHFHSQTTYVVEGTFEFMVGNNKKMVTAGDVIYMEPDVVHGTVCIEEGMLIDVFSPARQDFLDGSAVSYFGDKK